MIKSRRVLTSLLHRLGVAGPARVRAFRGSGAPGIARGSGTPKVARRLVLSVLVTTLAAVAFTAAPAFAAVPEAPVVTVEDSTAVVPSPSTEAVFHGVLDSGLVGEPGTYELGEYEFLYKAGATCTGGSVAPTPPGMSLGAGHEELPAEILPGLTIGTNYTVCLQIKTAGGTTLSTPVNFTTALPPEKPETTSPAKLITATTATLEGTLNPKKAGEAGSYEFLYRVSATECEGERASPSEPVGVMSGAVKQAVAVPVTALQPNATYTFCLLARNAAGETSVGPAVHFTTPPAAPVIESEATSSVKATEARLKGVVNPNNQVTECKFQYGTEPLLATGATTTPCEPESFPASFGGQGVGLNVSGLTADTTYYYRVLATNGTGTEPGAIEHFATALPPNTPEKAKATGVAATIATLHGILNPAAARAKEPGSDEFFYRQSATECRGENEIAIGATTAPGLLEKEPAQATVTELLPGATYTFCLLVRNEAGEETLGPPETLTTLAAAPVVEESSVSDVASSSATLQAKIDPEGSETTYRFEYGTSAAYGSSIPVPDGLVGSGSTGLTVSAHPLDLLPNTEYHYRVVALSPSRSETVPGADGAFTTESPGGSLVLPDGRQWEMVSPPNKHGAALAPIEHGSWPIQASAAGRAITYVATAPIEAQPPGNTFFPQVLSLRDSTGWESRDIALPHENPVPLTEPQEYLYFSEDLSQGIVEPYQGLDQALSKEASEPTAFVRTNYLNGDVEDPCIESCYRPVVTGAPGFADVPPGTEFGICEGQTCQGPQNRHCPPAFRCGPQFQGVSSDFSHVVVSSQVALAEGGSGGHGLYEWSGGKKLTYVGSGVVGSEEKFSQEASSSHAVSDDGRVIIKGESEGLTGLLLHDTVKGETVKLGEAGFYNVGATLQAASPDGSRIIFNTGNEFGAALEACEIVELAGHLHCNRSNLAPGATVFAPILGASEDASYVYFATNSVLTGEEKNAQGEEALPGDCVEQAGVLAETCNVYVNHDGVNKFIAVLSDADESDWGENLDNYEGGYTSKALTRLTARVSSDGLWVAFISRRSLTGYDNTASNGKNCGEIEAGGPFEHPGPLLCSEVYLYDAAAGGGAGKIICASCNPTGARPLGPASVPGWTTTLYQSRYLSSSGRLFFDSSDALVSQDTNNTADVYEYEPAGVGGCGEASATFSAGSGGCVGLISSGTSPEPSSFLDASENGNDVFFLTAAQLAPQDKDTTLDIYDAHVCSASAPCPPPPGPPPPACEGDACQSPVGAPEDATPGSLSFSGPGNLAPLAPVPVARNRKATKCVKGKKVVHGKCVKSKAKVKKKAKKARRSSAGKTSNERRAKS